MAFLDNQGGVTSTVNSSTTPLAAGATFTGTAEQNDYPNVLISVATDQNGTYYIEFSIDGTNWDTSLVFYYDTSRINPPHSFVKGSRYFRVRFTNTSATLQTYFRLQNDYGTFNTLLAPINGTVSENFEATVVRPTNYNNEVANGKRQGRELWNKFGYNDALSKGTEVVASWGGTFTPLTTATTIDIVSDSANDIVTTGTGVQQIVVYGIDANRDPAIEVIAMNGTTTVTTTSTWLGINRVAMFLCGTGKINDGTIDITAVSDGSTMAQMPADGGVTQQCIFHIPRNYNFNAEMIWINVLNQNKDAELRVKMWVYSAVSNGNQEVFRVDIDTQKSVEPLSLDPNLPFPISASTVIWLECTSDKDDVVINARFSGILERIQ